MTVQEAIAMLKTLPAAQRQTVLRAFREELDGASPEAPANTPPPRVGLRRFVARMGSAHSDYTDLSTDKQKHLTAGN